MQPTHAETDELIAQLTARIRNVPDFPKQGIQFKDITTLIADGPSLRAVLDLLAERYRHASVNKVVAMESRGFIFGAALADRLGCGFVPARKPGKLPCPTVKTTYALEYGSDSLEMHADAVRAGERVLILDDLLATGGTAQAMSKLLEEQGAIVVGCAFVIELASLGGRGRIGPHDVFSLIRFE
jgi:adenine phosphoribosyltransferase